LPRSAPHTLPRTRPAHAPLFRRAIRPPHSLPFSSRITDGTLIGQQRTGNFIPWDDDIDVSVDTSTNKYWLDYSMIEKVRTRFTEVHADTPRFEDAPRPFTMSS
jgi:hypothetical protein